MKILTIFMMLFACFKFAQPALFFPSNSAYGLFAAIAVPLDLPHRNVFVSYNFEANYNMPETWGIPPYATGVEDGDLFGDSARLNNAKNCNNCTTTTTSSDEEEENAETSRKDEATEEDYEDITTITPLANDTDASNSKRKKRRKREVLSSLLTRKHFYHILIDKFKRSGFKGEPCLLRLICDTNASQLGEVNGVLGNLIHIMFSPTTSRAENLPLTYYQAEIDGIHEQCHHYEKQCPESVLDLISTPLHKIIEQMEMNVIKLGK